MIASALCSQLAICISGVPAATLTNPSFMVFLSSPFGLIQGVFARTTGKEILMLILCNRRVSVNLAAG
jgi:hypothetical protein